MKTRALLIILRSKTFRASAPFPNHLMTPREIADQRLGFFHAVTGAGFNPPLQCRKELRRLSLGHASPRCLFTRLRAVSSGGQLAAENPSLTVAVTELAGFSTCGNFRYKGIFCHFFQTVIVLATFTSRS